MTHLGELTDSTVRSHLFLIGPDLKCNESIAVDKTCVNGEPWKPHFALNSSIVGLKNNTDIQREVLTHGPVTAAFKVFDDFFHYKSGVYNGCSPPANQSRKIAGKRAGLHCAC